MNLKSILVISIGLNVVCLILLLRPSRPVQSTEPNTVQVPAQEKMEPSPAEPEPALPSVRVSSGPVAPSFHWSQLESTDYATYIANLRAAGCPEQTIRDIISADLLAAMGNTVANGAGGGLLSTVPPRTRADFLANRLLYPPNAAVLNSGQVDGAVRDVTPADGLVENDPAASLLATQRQRRFEAIERLWVVDSIRARYGTEALLGWQQQAMREGISFAEFLERYQVPLPPPPIQQ